MDIDKKIPDYKSEIYLLRELIRELIEEKDAEIERLKAALNEIATTELICPEMKEKCEYMSDIALKALKEEGDG